MYVAVKGGERAISAAHAWLDETRRGDAAIPELTVAQVEQQMGLAVDRVMAEGSCHDRVLAALAIKQAKGDLIEAAANLFHMLREADRLAGPQGRISAAPIPNHGLGRAINDRLSRAAAPRP